MKIEMMKVTELIPYDNNPRNNDGAVEAVANSIKEFGFKVPIVVDKDNEIINGHTRLKAAYHLGMDEVPVIKADDLSDDQVKAFRLADNKTGEIAEWDFELLDVELEEIKMDMEQFGFEKEIDFELEDDDEREIVSKKEVYMLGTHKLVCGDDESKKDQVDIIVAAWEEYTGLEAEKVE